MLKSIELSGFKSFGKKSELLFTSPIAAIVGPNGSGKSNVAEAFRFVLGEQSMKSLRSKKGEDLIWGGSQGLARSNRAKVAVSFDNAAHQLAVDFPEVVIERVVYRDGVNEYAINGTKVRLKDVTALLSQANIGASGYHIISQGEADRVLSASPRERREMVEEALGLKLYQTKKVESEKKLEETDQNLHEVSLLRRELAPHLKYLQKQVEKIEQAQTLADDLGMKLSDYLSRERMHLTHERTKLSDEKQSLLHRAGELDASILKAREAVDAEQYSVHSKEGVAEAERVLAEVRAHREEVSRALGRAEGELSALRTAFGTVSDNVDEMMAQSIVVSFVEELSRQVQEALVADNTQISAILQSIHAYIERFRAQMGVQEHVSPKADTTDAVAQRVGELTTQFAQARQSESEKESALAALRARESEGREAYHSAERILIAHTSERREVSGKLAQVEEELHDLEQQKTRFDEEVREGVLLVGRSFSIEGQLPQETLLEDRLMQENRRRTIERLKIKIEEYRGVGADDVMKEFEETRERDTFLAREMEDLERSAVSLREIIAELDTNIEKRFEGGLSLITKEFNTFFVQLFGGGSATLTLERGHEQAEGEEAQPAGLAVAVQLPRKQVRGLEVLSGGERALTSIALIFAMSQVNPPPFLILDETDAALDEANSRRYAQIVEMLAKRSQLILITHNRATMAAAGELYGVTMGQDGVSKLLSVKLEEAQAVAK